MLHMDASVLAAQQELTSALCGHWIQSWRPTESDEW